MKRAECSLGGNRAQRISMPYLLILGFALMLVANGGHPETSGALSSIGSDTMKEVMARWGSEFIQTHPEVTFKMQTRGSATAPTPLIKHQSNLAPMTRLMTSQEVEAFRRSHGYEATYYRVALDALAVFVHKDNPVHGLTMDQVDSIFSDDHLCHRGFFSDSSPSTTGAT